MSGLTEVAGSSWWFAARSSGIVAWFLFTATALWGVFAASKFWQSAKRPKALVELHRWLAVLAWVFSAIHLVTLWADSYVEFGAAELFLPGASEWKTVPVAFGVIAFWILMAVQVSSLVRDRIGRRSWKWVHLTSYGAWWATTLHGILAGTDATNVVLRSASMSAISMLVVVATYRLFTRRTPGRSSLV